ncbi:hypothetical protein EDB81DRAFT_233269 [Dactylonectria macrodidyma]|uniref:Transmembrane protein n=1 Tax=Dactylonectria macrodidyma TaxID=307937 RepID=A0A9P9DK72_9HYPO|nr:hypothetical protein EDB81DRAFT_233269 [Dactylonectria macrodidyma]
MAQERQNVPGVTISMRPDETPSITAISGPSTKAASAKLSKAHPPLLPAPRRSEKLPRISKFQFADTPCILDYGESSFRNYLPGFSAGEVQKPPLGSADDYRPARLMQHFANYNTPVQSWSQLQSSTRIPVIENTRSIVPPKRPWLAKAKGTPTDTPAAGDAATSLDERTLQEHVAKSPTCSLNLVCYRSGTQGCKLRQIQTLNRARLPSDAAFAKALREQTQLVATDVAFFRELRTQYLRHMCSFWRRAFSLKTLRGFRLLQFTPTTRPTAVPLDEFEMQEILYAFRCPAHINTDHDWIDWVFRLRQVDHRHALEFVEGWNGARIAVAGSLPVLLSMVVGVVWSVRSGDVQTAFTVAGFILTAGTLMLALLAIISGIESSRALGSNI